MKLFPERASEPLARLNTFPRGSHVAAFAFLGVMAFFGLMMFAADLSWTQTPSLPTAPVPAAPPVRSHTPGPSQTPAQPETDPQLVQMSRDNTVMLIRNVLSALNQANETGNYTVLRDLGAPGFRDANSAARLAEIFASHRTQRLDLSGAAVIDPQVTTPPQMDASGLLQIGGYFPAVPNPVVFDLRFASVEGRWRVLVLSVNIAAPPVAQTAATPPATASEPKRPAPVKR